MIIFRLHSNLKKIKAQHLGLLGHSHTLRPNQYQLDYDYSSQLRALIWFLPHRLRLLVLGHDNARLLDQKYPQNHQFYHQLLVVRWSGL